MKKIILSALFLAGFAFTVNAQNIKPRVEAGVTFANQSISVSGSSLSPNSIIGARVGVAAEIGLMGMESTGLYLAPGLNYKMAGTKITEKLTNHNINLPVNAGVRFQFADNMAVALEFGPYAEYALSGDQYKNDEMKKFDLGLGGSAALEISRLYLRVGAEYGLMNLSKEGMVEKSTKNKNFFATVGFKF